MLTVQGGEKRPAPVDNPPVSGTPFAPMTVPDRHPPDGLSFIR
jgi:hypothetical protein